MAPQIHVHVHVNTADDALDLLERLERMRPAAQTLAKASIPEEPDAGLPADTPERFVRWYAGRAEKSPRRVAVMKRIHCRLVEMGYQPYLPQQDYGYVSFHDPNVPGSRNLGNLTSESFFFMRSADFDTIDTLASTVVNQGHRRLPLPDEDSIDQLLGLARALKK